jgi:hypothetical protein
MVNCYDFQNPDQRRKRERERKRERDNVEIINNVQLQQWCMDNSTTIVEDSVVALGDVVRDEMLREN